MVSGGGWGGRGGGRVGGGGSAGERKLSAAEIKRQRRTSGASRIRESYRWLHQGLKPTRAFERRESQYHRDLEASRSRAPPLRRSIFHDMEASSSSTARRATSSALALRRFTFSEGSSSSGPAPPPRDPAVYAEDEDIATIAARLEKEAQDALKPRDFVPEAALGTVKLVVEKLARDAKKEQEWRRQRVGCRLRHHGT